MRTRNQNIPACELRQQLIAGRRSRGRVDVEGHRDLGMLQLDALCMGDIVHAQRVQLQHPEVTVAFDIDPAAAAATRNQLLPKLAGGDVLIAGPHSSLFPPLGRLRKEGNGYIWAPVVFTDQWAER